MPTTINKGYVLQDTNGNIDTWGDVLNEDMIAVVDLNLGGLQLKSLGSSNVTLTAEEADNVMFRLSGALGANVQVTNPAVGFYLVENITTNDFDVTITNGVGSAVTVPQSSRCALFADTANGVRLFSVVTLTNPDPIPTGTRMMFTSAAVPTGWSLVSISDNSGLSLVNTTGGAISGSVEYDTLFARTATDGYTLLTADIPAHSHDINSLGTAGTGGVDGAAHWSHRSTVDGIATGTTDNVTGGSQAHTHPLDMRVKTVTVITGERID